MSQLSQIIETEEFKSLSIEARNEFLWDAFAKLAGTPMTAPEVPPLVLSKSADPNCGIDNSSGPNMVTGTLGSLNDILKTGLDLTLGLVGSIGGLAIDAITFGQRRQRR